jgi:hypothetical protein
MEELKESVKNNDSCKLYVEIYKIREGFQPRTFLRQNKQGVVVGDEKGILDVWADYFKEMLNPLHTAITPKENIYSGEEHDIRAISTQETQLS